jgi:hypothetical protein
MNWLSDLHARGAHDGAFRPRSVGLLRLSRLGIGDHTQLPRLRNQPEPIADV